MMLKKGNPVAGIIFIVLISCFAFFLLIVGFVGNEVATSLKPQIGITEEINNSLDTTITISTTTINTLWYILFAGLLLGLIVEAMLVPEYPKVMFPVFALTLIISIVIAIVLSNAYEEVANSTELIGTSVYQQGIAFVMGLLPYVAIVVGLLAILIIFTRGSGIGSSGGIVN